MSSQGERHSKLAPLGIELRLTLALEATKFFSPLSYRKKCAILGKPPNLGAIAPLEAIDFLHYLEKKGILKETNTYWHLIRHLLGRMASTDILIDMGNGPSGNVHGP